MQAGRGVGCVLQEQLGGQKGEYQEAACARRVLARQAIGGQSVRDVGRAGGQDDEEGPRRADR
eukprot:1962773-Lingulodinium_polyedra.AAC.1